MAWRFMEKSEEFQFNLGEDVVKVSGDYHFEGVVVAVFRKKDGKPRYVVENEAGILHIFSNLNLNHI